MDFKPGSMDEWGFPSLDADSIECVWEKKESYMPVGLLFDSCTSLGAQPPELVKTTSEL